MSSGAPFVLPKVPHFYVKPTPFGRTKEERRDRDEPCWRCGEPPDHPDHLRPGEPKISA